ncbi:hypothetical protein [Pseudopedobacter beijingensis]|uniref:DUF4906 domain-containing protein n=1 Tax=Pseudopedobacter beijingensis TaxID=1207056 RepID=A0ABW4IAR3_9SPHI
MKNRLILMFLGGTVLFMSLNSCRKDTKSNYEIIDSNFSIQMEVLPVYGSSEVENFIAWENVNEAGVWDKSSNHPNLNFNSKFQLKEQLEGNVSRFEGNLKSQTSENNFELFSVVPYNVNMGNDLRNMALYIPVNQVQKGESPDLLSKGYALGKTEVKSQEKDVEMKMDYALSALNFNIDFSNTILMNKHLEKITFSSEKAFVGGLIYDMVEDKIVKEPIGKNLTLTYVDKPNITGVNSGWIAIKPDDYSGENIKIEVTTKEGFVASFHFAINEAYKKGAAYTYEINLLELLTSGDAVLFEPMVDLSEKGTANSYIVMEEGKYKFIPTKGNSSEKPNGLQKVDWIWTTEENMVSNVKLEGGVVTFRYSGVKGNALIAGFNSANEIVWSWHIWGTDDPSRNLHYVNNDKYLLMDRNLGATSAAQDDVKAYGLYYQWGRKDPFMSSKVFGTKGKREESTGFTGATSSFIINPLYNRNFKSVANTTLTYGSEINYFIANPTTFISNTNASDGWANNSNLQELKIYENLWGYNSALGDNVKTIYDPCPVGFKVPSYDGDVWGNMSLQNSPVVTNIPEQPAGRLYTSIDGIQKGFYPAAGQRLHESGQLSYVGMLGSYWSSFSYFTSFMQGRALRMETPVGGTATIRTNIKVGTAYGASIRCACETK